MSKSFAPEPQVPNINLIGPGTLIKGEVKANGDIRIDGTIHGKLQSKGKVVIGATGVVEGEVQCQNADISGMVKGNIQVAELLVIKVSAKIQGDIQTAKISIEPGAVYSGNCNMTNIVPKENKIYMGDEQFRPKETN